MGAMPASSDLVQSFYDQLIDGVHKLALANLKVAVADKCQ
jgi:hypothetical protein